MLSGCLILITRRSRACEDLQHRRLLDNVPRFVRILKDTLQAGVKNALSILFRDVTAFFILYTIG